MVNTSFYFSQHFVSQFAEVRPFRDLLAYQPVCVLVCTSLPGVVRACEVELSFESLRDLLVAGEFLTVISSYQMYLNLVEACASIAVQASLCMSADQHQMRTPVVCHYDGTLFLFVPRLLIDKLMVSVLPAIPKMKVLLSVS